MEKPENFGSGRVSGIFGVLHTLVSRKYPSHFVQITHLKVMPIGRKLSLVQRPELRVNLGF